MSAPFESAADARARMAAAGRISADARKREEEAAQRDIADKVGQGIISGAAVLVVCRPYYDAPPDSRREVRGICRAAGAAGITIQPDLGGEPLPGALFLIPWAEVVQVMAQHGTIGDLVGLERLLGR